MEMPPFTIQSAHGQVADDRIASSTIVFEESRVGGGGGGGGGLRGLHLWIFLEGGCGVL